MKEYVCIKEINLSSGERTRLGQKFKDEPLDGKGNSLVHLSERDLRQGKTPAFKEVEIPKPKKMLRNDNLNYFDTDC